LELLDYSDNEYTDNPEDLVPSLEHLEEILSGMFWASTQMEEGRFPRFRAIYAGPVKSRSFGLEFAQPIQWESEEIRKIAPAVTPPDGRICIFPYEGKLFIQGMQSKISINDPQRVMFEILDPARITIQFPQYENIAEIKGYGAGFIDELWSDASRDLISLESIRNKNNDDFSLIYRVMTQEILSRIRLLRHGGSLLFVSNLTNLGKSLETPIHYKSGSNFNAIKLIKDSAKEYLKENIDKPIAAEIKALKLSLNKLRMADSARTVAYLSAVDGATILNNKFEVIAFGTKIKEIPATNEEKQKVKMILPLETDEEPKQSLLVKEFRGKRHLSVARFVLNNPGSIGFAISQDGGITGFVMHHNQLVAYKGLELLR
jgi:hypothetical protein